MRSVEQHSVEIGRGLRGMPPIQNFFLLLFCNGMIQDSVDIHDASCQIINIEVKMDKWQHYRSSLITDSTLKAV